MDYFSSIFLVLLVFFKIFKSGCLNRFSQNLFLIFNLSAAGKSDKQRGMMNYESKPILLATKCFSTLYRSITLTINLSIDWQNQIRIEHKHPTQSNSLLGINFQKS